VVIAKQLRKLTDIESDPAAIRRRSVRSRSSASRNPTEIDKRFAAKSYK
jgi:hypothetical protein